MADHQRGVGHVNGTVPRQRLDDGRRERDDDDFTLVARNASGATATANATVTRHAAPTAAIQAALEGTNTARLTWQTTNAVSATVNGNPVPVNGSTTVP